MLRGPTTKIGYYGADIRQRSVDNSTQVNLRHCVTLKTLELRLVNVWLITKLAIVDEFTVWSRVDLLVIKLARNSLVNLGSVSFTWITCEMI